MEVVEKTDENAPVAAFSKSAKNVVGHESLTRSLIMLKTLMYARLDFERIKTKMPGNDLFSNWKWITYSW